MKLTPDARGLVALNIRVKDPIWPGRDMIDLSVSVRPNEARTLWLDLRDRILTHDSLYLTIASAAPDFGAGALDGARLRLVFKPRAEAAKEHVADRFNQVKDNWGFLVEEHTASKRAALYARLFADATDLLRVDPDHVEGRAYWADIDYRPENLPPVALPPVPAGVPAWAHWQLEDLRQVRRFVEWWIDDRQVAYGDFGGGISDDSDLVQQWPGAALMGLIPDKITASLTALSDAVYRNGMITGGLGTITTDELHAYEEGLNSDAARLYLRWGEPKAVERIMATTRALESVILRNPAGHLHFASSWYGGRKIYRDDAWSWQKPYAFGVLHGPTLLGVYNGNPRARALVTGTVDGLLAHGKRGADGLWSYPNEINWSSDAERAGDGGGATLPLQSVWAAWRWTGDARYLRPLEARVAKAGPASLGEINDDVFGLLPQGTAWRDAAARATGDDPATLYARWSRSGDPAALATLHQTAARDKAARAYMMTEGHWWSDRVEASSEWLQRERLGGIALRRGQHWPANAVSWRFADPRGAEQVALLVKAEPARIRITAFNTGAGARSAEMSTWNVAAGEWRMTVGGATTAVTLERGAAVPVSFAPGQTIIELELVRAGEPVDRRPDLGLGADDVTVKGRRVSLVVHSLGARATAGGTASLVADGRVLATATIPPLDAPADLVPRTARVTLTLPRGVDPRSIEAAVSLPGEAPEVTRRNNRVPVVPSSAPDPVVGDAASATLDAGTGPA
jgi:hypothetical protein